MKFITFYITTLLVLSSNVALAKWDVNMSLGYGQRTNPFIQSKSTLILANIDIAWYGDQWFFDNGDIGRTLWSNDSVTLNAVGQITNERNFFSKTSTQFFTVGGNSSTNSTVDFDTVDTPVTDTPASPSEGSGHNLDHTDYYTVSIPDRNYTIEAGIESFIDLPIGSLYTAASIDTLGVHNGYRANIGYQIQRIINRWHISTRTSAEWHSQQLNDYYYGVKAEESNRILSEYTAAAGTNYRLSLVVNYAINPKLFWGTHISTLHLDNTISNSPIINNNNVHTLFTGFKYLF